MKRNQCFERFIRLTAALAITVGLTLAMLAAGAESAAGAYDFAGIWEDEVSQRAWMEARQDGDRVDILVHWGSSAVESSTWEISGECDPATGALTYADAAYTVTEWDEAGNDTVIEEDRSSGAFTWEGGKLRWRDSLNTDDGLFVRQTGAADDPDSEAYPSYAMGDEFPEADAPEPLDPPTPEVLKERYFDVLANLETGTAGASLKTAAAASEVCAFAEAYELYNPDVAGLRANMLAAFESMDEAAQTAFWQGFDAVLPLLDDCLEDWEGNRALFEDAGVTEAMDEIMYDPLNRLAWENLRNHTLTLGNDEV